MLKVAHSITDVEKDFFSVCPLLTLGSWNYYLALEKSQSLSLQNGWNPQYITYYVDNKRAGFIPAFSRTSSGDDFSYDMEISKAFTTETQKEYYPKLQVCIPFMPIEGSKFYFAESFEFNKKVFLKELTDWAKNEKVSSLHITLPDASEYGLFEEAGFTSSEQSLCYWQNKNYASFSDFLGDLKSKYRSQISQERKTVKQGGYTSECITSATITKQHVDTFYDLFEQTHQRRDWIMSKLTREFFHLFTASNPDQIVFFFTKKNGNTVASSCHFLETNMLCGRFWGSTHDEHFLHFEVMYYLPIEFCIQQQIASMEIGFEKQHKVIRGFVPKTVKTFHYFFDAGFQSKLNDFIPHKKFTDKKIFK